MTEPTPKNGPSLADAPQDSPIDAKVFGYDVASQARQPAPKKPNPNSPLAAG